MKTVQTIARAYQQICTGEEPWIALGNFRNAWYGYAKDDRLALVSDPITEPEFNNRHTRRWGAFCRQRLSAGPGYIEWETQIIHRGWTVSDIHDAF